jgi:tetratricopeptide (TPR) repeat protein
VPSTWLRMSRKTIIWLFAAMAIFASPIFGQSNTSVSSDDALLNQRFALLSELQSLGARAKLLEAPLARALAQTEVADAAWFLDQDLATKLLRDSIGLTLPSEPDQSKSRSRAVGAPPRLPSPAEMAGAAVRFRILQVAGRDRALLKELSSLVIDKIGGPAGHQNFADLANDAIAAGDNEAAEKYLTQAIDADPTQVNASYEIGRLATKDRDAADRVILAYINRLRSTPLSFSNGSEQRVFYALASLVLAPKSNFGAPGINIISPTPAVIREYVAYTIELLSRMTPEQLRSSRGYLIAIWPMVQQYAPELKQQFFDLEQRSRAAGENLSLPTPKSIEREYKETFEKRVNKELESDQPDAIVIQRVITQGDFSKARKLIDKLADGPQKTELTEMLYAQQAISLANKGDIPGAQKLAESLAKATSILKVFPVIAGKCAAKNDDVCARDSVNQAVRQLKKSDVTPFTPIPTAIFGTKREVDPVLSSLGSLVSSVLSLRDELALDVLDELVVAANHSELDTSQARTGFETSLFKKLAAKNEERTTAVAYQFQDPLRQIVALAGIEQWKSDKLAADEKLRSAKNDPAGKKN